MCEIISIANTISDWLHLPAAVSPVWAELPLLDWLSKDWLFLGPPKNLGGIASQEDFLFILVAETPSKTNWTNNQNLPETLFYLNLMNFKATTFYTYSLISFKTRAYTLTGDTQRSDMWTVWILKWGFPESWDPFQAHEPPLVQINFMKVSFYF